MEGMKESAPKTKMTTSWTDYLLCQLSSNKKLSTLECLAPELLEPILKELHEQSVAGLRDFSQASRTCRALASPYRFKPLHVKFDGLFLNSQGPTLKTRSTLVTLSYGDDWKTLRIHNPPCRFVCANAAEQPSFQDLLNSERSFEGIEYMPDIYRVTHSRGWADIDLPVEVFYQSCPWLAKIVINLGYFISYKSGHEVQESEHHESKAVWQRNVRALASFQNLRHLYIHFELRGHQAALMHPSQSEQAVCEIYHQIEWIKEGVRLTQLDMSLHIRQTYLFGRHPWWPGGWRGEAQIVYSYKYRESSSQGKSYQLICHDPLLANLIERRWKAMNLYGKRVWHVYLGPWTWKWWLRSKATDCVPSVTRTEIATRVALLPSRLFPSHIEPAPDIKCLRESAISQPRLSTECPDTSLE